MARLSSQGRRPFQAAQFTGPEALHWGLEVDRKIPAQQAGEDRAQSGGQLEINYNPLVCIMLRGQRRVSAHGKLRELWLDG